MTLSQHKLQVLIAGGTSDSHTWNLVFLQLLIEEAGHRVINLGPCVPPPLLLARCRARTPDLVIISSVNGHGYRDGLRTITALRADPALTGTAVVIGGKLGITAMPDETAVAGLIDAGFTEVFADTDIDALLELLARLSDHALRAPHPERV